MNKEKQIEEMRKDLIEIFDEEYNKRGLITPDFTSKKLVDLNYRKITDSVVLTETERIAMCVEQWDKGYAQALKETTEKILNEIYTTLWDEKTPIANSFVNLDVKIREIAIREGVEIKED